MTALEALKQQPLFSWINNAPLEYLVEQGETRALLNGDHIYQAGSPGDAIFLILEGDVEFTSDSGSGKTLSKGSIFGECSIIELKERTCTAKAKGNTSLLVLNHEVLYKFSAEFPDPYSIVVTNLARCLAAQIRNLNEKKATTQISNNKEEASA
ncbi:MAG: Crp/Fnr family transcriptional regulator [Verrucomicrobiota bacterium]